MSAAMELGVQSLVLLGPNEKVTIPACQTLSSLESLSMHTVGPEKCFFSMFTVSPGLPVVPVHSLHLGRLPYVTDTC